MSSQLQEKYAYLKGKRIHLIAIDNDDRADLQASRLKNLYGTVTSVDGMGQLHVAWENSRSGIAVVPYLDQWELA